MKVFSRGNTANVINWTDGNVWIGTMDAVPPEPGQDYGTGWSYVGALDGGKGFDGSRDSSQQDHTAWGLGVVNQTDKDYKETVSFTAMENNIVIQALKYPGTIFNAPAADGSQRASLRVPSPGKFKISFETANAEIAERKTSLAYAKLSGWPKDTKTEDGVETSEISVVIFPNANKELWDWQKFSNEDGAVAPTQPVAP